MSQGRRATLACAAVGVHRVKVRATALAGVLCACVLACAVAKLPWLLKWLATLSTPVRRLRLPDALEGNKLLWWEVAFLFEGETNSVVEAVKLQAHAFLSRLVVQLILK